MKTPDSATDNNVGGKTCLACIETVKTKIVDMNFTVMRECVNDLCEIIDILTSYARLKVEDADYITERTEALKAYVEQQSVYFEHGEA